MKYFLKSVPPTVIAALSDEHTQLMHLSLRDGYKYVFKHFFTLNERDIIDLKAALQAPFTSVDTFESEASDKALKIASLGRNGHVMNVFDQMEIITNCAAYLPVLIELIIQFKRETPPSNRTRTKMVASVVANIPNIPRSMTITTGNVHSYAGATTSTPRLYTQVEMEAAVDKAVQKALALHSHSTSTTNRMYCFLHGTNDSHTGIECKVMGRNKVKYTPAMVNAKKQSTINGEVGKA